MVKFLVRDELGSEIRKLLVEPGVRCAVAFWGAGAEELVTAPGARIICNLRMGGANPAVLRKVKADLRMRREGATRHPGLRWVDDRLPELAAVHRLGFSYDLVLLSAVWMYLPPRERPRAFRKLVTLLKSDGLLVLTLRHGPGEPGRVVHPVSLGELEVLARDHGLAVVRALATPDRLARPGVTWTTACLRLPDAGSLGLPLLRGVILNDDKSSTYKLGLLRAVARIADAAPALATPVPGEADRVAVPLGLIALNWIRAYLPLVAAGLRVQ